MKKMRQYLENTVIGLKACEFTNEEIASMFTGFIFRFVGGVPAKLREVYEDRLEEALNREVSNEDFVELIEQTINDAEEAKYADE